MKNVIKIFFWYLFLCFFVFSWIIVKIYLFFVYCWLLINFFFYILVIEEIYSVIVVIVFGLLVFFIVIVIVIVLVYYCYKWKKWFEVEVLKKKEEEDWLERIERERKERIWMEKVVFIFIFDLGLLDDLVYDIMWLFYEDEEFVMLIKVEIDLNERFLDWDNEVCSFLYLIFLYYVKSGFGLLELKV